MIELFDLLISPESSLQVALERMTRNKKGLLMVCDEGEHLVGVISDGDIRRAILNNALLISSIDSYMNLDPIFARSISAGKELLEKSNNVAIPIVNDEGIIIAAVVQGVDQVEVIEKVVETAPANAISDAIAIIPARGGSKRIYKKNIALVAGKPLIAHAIEAARKVPSISEVLVSTDDEEIASVARKFGADVPWMRPAHLAQDDTPSIDVVIHAVEWARKHLGQQTQYGVLLEPTAPLRTPEHILSALDILKSSDADSVVSVSQIPHVFNPEELLAIEDQILHAHTTGRTLDNRLPRGKQTPLYVQNGLVYAFRLDMLLKKKSLYGDKCLPLIIDWNYFLDIDSPADLDFAEYKINSLNKSTGRK